MNTVIRGKSVHFNDKYLSVELDDGRVISTPMAWYKELQSAPFSVLKDYSFICCGIGIEWTELDCQLSIESMLVAVPAHRNARLTPEVIANRSKVDDAIMRLKAIRKGVTHNGLSWKELRGEGRR